MSSRRNSGASLSGPRLSRTPYPVFDHLHSFQEFVALQAEGLQPSKALELYNLYKYDFNVVKVKDLYRFLQGTGFVTDRYGHETLRTLCRAKTIRGRQQAAQFIKDFDDKRFSTLNLSFDLMRSSKPIAIVPSEFRRSAVIASTGIPFSESVINVKTHGSNFLKSKNQAEVSITIEDIEDNRMDTDMDTVQDIELLSTTEPGGFNSSSFSPLDMIFISDPNLNGCSLILPNLPAETKRQHIESLLVNSNISCSGFTLIPTVTTALNAMAIQSLSVNDEVSILSENNIESNSTMSRNQRNQILTIIDQTPPHASAYLDAPNKNLLYLPRLSAYIEFDTEDLATHAEVVLTKMDIPEVNTSCRPLRLSNRPPKSYAVSVTAPICSSPSRMESDIQKSASLIEKLDNEFFIFDPRDVSECYNLNSSNDDISEAPATHSAVGTNFLSKISHLSDRQKVLDLQILYLRVVHCFDFYQLLFCWTPRELFEVAGAATVRPKISPDHFTSGVYNMPSSGPSDGLRNSFLSHFEMPIDHYDEYFTELINFDFMKYSLPLGDTHPAVLQPWVTFCDRQTMPVDAEKFRCSLCRKLFKGVEFVHKHIRNKHEEEFTIVLNEASQVIMNEGHAIDPFKLFLFVNTKNIPRENFPSAFLPGLRPSALTAATSSGYSSDQHSGYGPIKRNVFRRDPNKPYGQGGYRDWDAPKTRAAERTSGGSIRNTIKYDDL